MCSCDLYGDLHDSLYTDIVYPQFQDLTSNEKLVYIMKLCQIPAGKYANHYTDVIMTTMAPQTTNLAAVYSSVPSDADQRKHQSSASLAFVWEIHRGRWNPRTKAATRKMFPFDDVIKAKPLIDAKIFVSMIMGYRLLSSLGDSVCRDL